MLNKISNKKWDGVDILELYLDNYKAVIIPELGGNIVKLAYCDEDILNTPGDLDSYKMAQNNFGIPHLFPPNRIKNGRFEFDGREHQFPIKPSGNSLHGFLHFSRWKIEGERIEENFVSLTLSYRSEKKADYSSYFPYEFKCTREYRLDLDGLTENYKVENLGNNPMPLSIGFHTAFPLTKEARIKVDLGMKVILDDTKIPTGEIGNLDNWEVSVIEDGADPNFKNLDNLYTANKLDEEQCHIATITGNHSKGDIIYEVDGKYGYWVLCNYASRGDIICIEPQTSSIDAYNQKDGNLIALEGKNSWKATNKLYIKKEK